jgi:hypothetical protein
VSEYAIEVDEAMSRLVVIEDYDSGNGSGPHVHTYRQAGPMLMGAHWGLEAARKAMEQFGVAEAGESATAMSHGIVVIDDHGPVFFECTPKNNGV